MRLALILALLVATSMAVVTAAALALDPGLRERLKGDTVETRIARYVNAVLRDDRPGALDAWQLDPRRANADEIDARRRSTTDALLALGVRRYAIERIDWWRSCCEPGVTDGPRNAGLGRAVVRLDADRGSHWYVFDVLAQTTAYWGDAGGNPPHEWTLRDVYPAGERPAFARFADVARIYPDVVAAVRTYYDRFAEALVACDVQRLWTHYPGLATRADLGSGVNTEEAHVRGLCGTRLRAARFDLEARAPLLVHEHGGTFDVTVHGMEWFDYAQGNGGGEFKTTLSLQRVAGVWTVIRTDAVTLAEWHERSR